MVSEKLAGIKCRTKGDVFMYRRTVPTVYDAKIEERIQKMKDDSNRQHQEYLAKMDAKMEADQQRAEARLAADRKEAEARQRATEERLAQERKEAEARLAADRKEAEARLAADRKEAEARLAADRKEAEARQLATEERLAQERMESEKRLRSQSRWLVATFFTAFFAMIGVFVSLLITNGYLPF